MAKGTVLARLRPRVLAVVAAIPEGRVTTYGAIARRLRATPRRSRSSSRTSRPKNPRRSLVPRRGRRGDISTTKLGETGRRQIAHLRTEGIAVTLRHTIIDFDAVYWEPPNRRLTPRKRHR